MDRRKIQAQTAAARNHANELAAGLDGVRLHIIKLQERRHSMAVAPVEIEMAHARVDEWIDDLKRTALDKGPRARQFIAAPSRWSRPDDGIAETFQHFLSAHVAAAIKAEIDALYADTDGISEAARTAQLDELDRQILDAELVEESTIREMEDFGLRVTRRPNADPAAVLAAAKALP